VVGHENPEKGKRSLNKFYSNRVRFSL
jgi:hypothetical protein